MTESVTQDPLAVISDAGVSIWQDDLSRDSILSGDLARMIAERHVVGVTTNPTIFDKALANGTAYDAKIAKLAESGTSLADAVIALTTDDVRDACDVFTETYEATGGSDGRVSIEVEPGLARDTAGTVEQAKLLWDTVERPNLCVKIPATVEGLEAITAATAAGISVNVTLIFSLERYRAVAQAYVAGLEQAAQAGLDLSKIHSFASVFLSRIDSKVDAALKEIGSPQALELRGKAAIAGARLCYEAFEEIFATDRFAELAAKGANKQRPLWASTGTKDPSYPDTMYIDELVVPGVVSTIPRKTIEAVRDHSPATGEDTVHGTYDASRKVIEDVIALSVPYDALLQELEDEGLVKFEKNWSDLLSTISEGLKAGAKEG